MSHAPGQIGGDGHHGLYATSGAGGPAPSDGDRAPGSSDPAQDPGDPHRNKGWRGCLQVVAAFAFLILGFWVIVAAIDAVGLSAR